MTEIDLHDRYRGCLFGLACGDALGGAVEFRSRADIAAEFPDGVRDILGGGPHGLEIGEVTDDTAMALAIARALGPNGIDLPGVAANFLAWYRSGPKDIGISTAAALRHLDRGLAWDEAGERLQRESPHGIAGNGSVMRCAPIALRFRSHPDALCQSSIDATRITHADPKATWGAVALNQAIAHLLDGGDVARAGEAAVAEVPQDDVVRAITRVDGLAYDDVPSDGYVLDTLTAAFWCLRHRDSAEEAIVTGVAMGLDTDTTGAVTGALCGAAYGIASIPARWRDVIHHADELETLASRLLQWDQSDSSTGRLTGDASLT